MRLSRDGSQETKATSKRGTSDELVKRLEPRDQKSTQGTLIFEETLGLKCCIVGGVPRNSSFWKPTWRVFRRAFFASHLTVEFWHSIRTEK